MAKKRTPSVDPETITKLGTWRVDKQLYVQVRDQGTRSWLFRYQRNGRPRWMGLGPVDLVKPDEAKAQALEYRALLLRGIDPFEHREAERPAPQPSKPAASKAPTFEALAEKFIAAHRPGWSNPKHAQQWESTLATYAYPVIGALPVDQIEVAHVLEILQPIWATKSETASRLRGRIEAILDSAEVQGHRTGKNPARLKGNLQHLLPPLKRVRRIKHHEAVPIADVPALVAELRSREHISAKALLFTCLTAARTKETRLATWDELDLDAGVWTLAPERMKGRREHQVPLAPAVVELLRSLPRDGKFVFPGAKQGRPLSDMAQLELLRGLRGMGATVHGLRSSFRDWAAEAGYPDEVAEAALAHADTNKTRAAYLRSTLIEQRREMMIAWAAHCLGE